MGTLGPLIICQECRDSGLKSKVFGGGGGWKTLMAHQPYWDEEGVYHSHDPNWNHRSYRCSNKHEWDESWLSPCPAGDYGGKPKS